MIKIYIADVSSLDLSALHGGVSRERQERILRCANDADKRRLLGAGLLLKSAVGTDGYVTGENGRPYFPDGHICFSLSHCGDCAVCAVSDAPVGVDIELPRQNSVRLAQRFFAPDEAASCTDDNDFCRLWTLKESYIKLRGLRLADIASFSVLSMPEVNFISLRQGEYRIGCCSEKYDSAEIIEQKL